LINKGAMERGDIGQNSFDFCGAAKLTLPYAAPESVWPRHPNQAFDRRVAIQPGSQELNQKAPPILAGQVTGIMGY
jgi:hypothetical protein